MLQAVQLKLWEAAELGDAAEVHRCMQAGANAAVANRLGWNALHRACMSGSLQSIVHLLPTGSDEAAKVRATGDQREATRRNQSGDGGKSARNR